MKTRLLLLGLSSLIFILFSSCQEENDFSDYKIYQGNAKLKSVLLFATIDSENPISIVEEYEYDAEDRISMVSSPMYQDGKIAGTIHYDLYEYNSNGQLVKIENYNANINSPTGIINLKNYIYTYSRDGKMEKEYIEYPQGSFEYSLYIYNNDRLVRIEKYGNTDMLESYVVNEYDNLGKLIKEISYAYDNQPYSNTQHFYSKGLITKSDVYAGKDMEQHIREILKTYDENNNLIILESNELSLFSCVMSYIFKYEYYKE